MAAVLRRKHVIGIRLSETEYEAMSAYCLQNEVRSVADLGRKAILAYITPDQAEHAPDVLRLEKQIKALRTEMNTLKSAQQNQDQKPGKGGVNQ